MTVERVVGILAVTICFSCGCRVISAQISAKIWLGGEEAVDELGFLPMVERSLRTA